MGKSIRVTRVYLKEVQDDVAREKLENRFMEVETIRTEYVRSARHAQIAAADAAEVQAKYTKSQTQFLDEVSDHCDIVATEPMWMTFRDQEGQIVLEAPFTARDQRNAVRATRAQLDRQADADDMDDAFDDSPGD